METKRQTIEIFFAVDENFVRHLCVSIASLLYNADENDLLNLYIMNKSLSQTSRENILSLKQIKECTIEFIQVDDKLFDSLKSPYYINSSSTFYRYLIPVVKPQIDKALYLDADIVVKESLYDLFNIPMDDCYIAGVEDVHVLCREVKLKPRFQWSSPYLNAGVLLLNCKKMRENDFTRKCFELSPRLNTQTYFGADQDVLNILCAEQKKIIDIKYNVLSAVFYSHKNTQYSDSQIENAIKSPVIIHYSDKIKPWHFLMNQLAVEYHKYLSLTPYAKNKRIFFIKCAILNESVIEALRRIKHNHFVKALFGIFSLVPAFTLLGLGLLSSVKCYRKNRKEAKL